jgi:hypothetical protein
MSWIGRRVSRAAKRGHRTDAHSHKSRALFPAVESGRDRTSRLWISSALWTGIPANMATEINESRNDPPGLCSQSPFPEDFGTKAAGDGRAGGELMKNQDPLTNA